MSDLFERLRGALSDRYRVVRELGAGGMATVFLAEDLKHGREVALKVLDPELGAAIGPDRFLREVRIVTGLNHPHIVPVHDSGEVDGLLYYVMPHVQGESLAVRLRRDGPLPLDEALRLLREIAGALDYAHRLGVVHRDIKPGNILLSEGHALLADFGIAHAMIDAGDERLTGPGLTVGSVLYMSPEQAAGEGAGDVRSDIYSLGCLAFEMLTGDPPFRGSAVQVTAQHMTAPPPSLRRGDASIPREVDEAIRAALAKEPPDRPASAGAFAEALGGERIPRTRTRLPWAAAAVVLLGLAAGGLWLRGPLADGAPAELDPLRVAVLYFDDLTPDEELRYLSEGLTEALIQELSRVEPLEVVSRNGVKPFRDLDFPVDSLARVLSAGHLVEGSVERDGDELVARIRLVDGRTGTEHASDEIRASGSDPLALRSRIVDGAARFLGQELGRGLQLSATREETDSDEAWTAVQEAQALTEDADLLRWELGDAAAAERVLRRADSLLARAEAADPAWPEPLVRRGWVASQLARLRGSRGSRSEPLLREGVEHAERALETWPDHPDGLELRGSLLNDLSWLNSVAADPELSDELQRRAEADLRRAGSAGPGRARAWVALADLLRVQGNFAEASVAAQRALEADPFLINAEKEILFTLSQVWLDLGQVERALEWSGEGVRRYPAEVSFAATKLVILAGWPDAPASPDTAWALAETLAGWAPARLLVAGVLARAGLADSARNVVAGVRSSGSDDPWLDYYEANTRIQLGEEARAVELLGDYLDALPSRRSYIASDWWWRPLEDRPGFQALVTVPD